MYLTSDQRITLAPEAVSSRPSGTETVMLGHYTGTPDWRHLLGMKDAVDLIQGLGFSRQVTILKELAARNGLVEHADDVLLKGLMNLPIPVTSENQFNAIFPPASSIPVLRKSYLSDDRTWLHHAVRDFFSFGEQKTGKTLWIIRVAEQDGARAFLPRANADSFSLDPWTGLGPFEIACLPPDAAFLAFPDLERLQLPAKLRDLPQLDIPSVSPRFLPCDDDLPPIVQPDTSDDTPPADPLPFGHVLGEIALTVSRIRPDLHILLTIPFAPEGISDRGYPAPSAEALVAARNLEGHPSEAGLRQIQMLYPYLRSSDRKLSSPVGLLAARMVESTARFGPWASVAGRRLSLLQSAYPPLPSDQVNNLRDDYGLGVLTSDNGELQLDDERLTRRAFGSGSGGGSGEIARFIGWLRRQLRAYGERLIFVTDPDDPRPGMILDSLFRRLYAQGALAGRVVEDSFSVHQRTSGEGILAFDIALQPAAPIDRIHITLSKNSLDLAPSLAGGA